MASELYRAATAPEVIRPIRSKDRPGLQRGDSELEARPAQQAPDTAGEDVVGLGHALSKQARFAVSMAGHEEIHGAGLATTRKLGRQGTDSPLQPSRSQRLRDYSFFPLPGVSNAPAAPLSGGPQGPTCTLPRDSVGATSRGAGRAWSRSQSMGRASLNLGKSSIAPSNSFWSRSGSRLNDSGRRSGMVGGKMDAMVSLEALKHFVSLVPQLMIEDVLQSHAKYQAFDEHVALLNLGAASIALQPSMTSFQGAVMVADVKGFTQLTEALSKRGTSGVELLTTCMNSYFSLVIKMILDHGGDVVKFAGDAMIVAFCPTAAEKLQPDERIVAATERCVQCALKLVDKLGCMRMRIDGEVEAAPPPQPSPQPAGVCVGCTALLEILPSIGSCPAAVLLNLFKDRYVVKVAFR